MDEALKTSASREGKEVIQRRSVARTEVKESTLGEARPVVLTQPTGHARSRRGGVLTAPPNLPAAIDLLERQACNCLPKIQCLRCELLGLLGPQQQSLFAVSGVSA